MKEIVIVRGSKVMELVRPDEAGRLRVVYSSEVFGVIRSLAPLRFMGSQRDYIMVGSDSGKLVVLEFDAVKNCFKKVIQETFGRSGCRRVVPGEYVAVDPKGRAAMVAAVEKQKFAYIFSRSAESGVSVSSPLEAHKSSSVVHALCALDTGFDAPEFAALEVSHEDLDSGARSCAEKFLVTYAVDLQLNQVVRKSAVRVPFSAHALVPLAGAGIPSGAVLVCYEDAVELHASSVSSTEPLAVCAFPRRLETPSDRTTVVSAHATHRLKGGQCLAVLQADSGDLFRAEVLPGNALRLSYFDSIPCSVGLCFLRSGQLFAASEAGDSYLFQVASLGSPDAPALTSATPVGDALCPYFPTPLRHLQRLDEVASCAPVTKMHAEDLYAEGAAQVVCLGGRGKRSSLRVLRHGLGVVEFASNELPGVASGVWALKESNSAAYDKYLVVSFRDSTLVLEVTDSIEESDASGLLKHVRTLHVALLADDSMLQVHPGGWRLIPPPRYRGVRPPLDWRAPPQHPIVAASSTPTQLTIATDNQQIILFETDGASGQLVEVASKLCGAEVASVAMMPCLDGELRSSLIAVGVADNTVRVISIHPQSRQLRQTSGQALPSSASAESVAIVPVSHKSVVYPAHLLEQGGVAMGDDSAFGANNNANTDTPAGGDDDETGGQTLAQRLAASGQTLTVTSWYLVVGCSNGVVLRAVLDPSTGTLSDQRSRFLGARPVTLFPVRDSTTGAHALMALSARPWILRAQPNSTSLVTEPLSLGVTDLICSLHTEGTDRAFVALQRALLRIFSLDAKGATTSPFTSMTFPLSFTPRGVVFMPSPVAYAQELTASADDNADPEAAAAAAAASSANAAPSKLTVVIEADHGAYDLATQREIRGAIAQVPLEGVPPCPDAAAITAGDESMTGVKTEDTEDDEEDKPKLGIDGVLGDQEGFRGSLVAGEGRWGSCIRLLDTSGGAASTHDFGQGAGVLDLIELEADTAALCCAQIVFEEFTAAPLLVVGIAKHAQLNLRVSQLADEDAPEAAQPSYELRVYCLAVRDAPKTRGSSERIKLPALQLLHATPVESAPTALCAVHGRLVVGLGRCVRLYALGHKRLLRKSDFRGVPEGVAWMVAAPGTDPRVFVGDKRESVLVLKFLVETSSFTVMAEDSLPRYSVAGAALDTLSIAHSDKFGNVTLSRVPPDAVAAAGQQEALANAALGNRTGAGASGKLSDSVQLDGLLTGGKTPKLETLASFFVGDVVTALRKTKLSPGAAECILAGTISGGLVALSPLSSKEDVDSLLHLELLMRQLAFDNAGSGVLGAQRAKLAGAGPLCGRDHAAYRGYFGPVQSVIDGDLLEGFTRLPADVQASLAAQLEKTPHEVAKKLEDLRTKVL